MIVVVVEVVVVVLGIYKGVGEWTWKLQCFEHKNTITILAPEDKYTTYNIKLQFVKTSSL